MRAVAHEDGCTLCVEDDELQDRALAVAERLRDGALNAIRWTKYALNQWYRMAGPAFDAAFSVAGDMASALGINGVAAQDGGTWTAVQ